MRYFMSVPKSVQVAIFLRLVQLRKAQAKSMDMSVCASEIAELESYLLGGNV